MKTRYALALMFGLAGTLLSGSSAQAQWGAGVGGFGGYGGYGAYDVGRLYDVLSQNVPYYAAFPPVYYSAPVPRSYGHSPFAYPPGTRTPEVVQVAAQEIINPHFPTSPQDENDQSDQVTRASSAPRPLSIVNPFVTPRLAEHTER